MKFYSRLLAVLAFALIFTACSKDDEDVSPQQELEEASLAFDQQNPPVEVPTAIQSSDAPEAQAISGFITQVNQMSTYTAYFEVPEGAEKSSDPIETNSGGRIAATQEDVLVYTWSTSDGQGNTVTAAYQVSEDDDFYYFEYFLKYNDEPFISVVKGAESKSELKEGYLEWFSESGTDGSYLFRYEWEESADGTFSFNFLGFDSKVSLVISPDGSGVIQSYDGGVIQAEYTWNADGTAGTYTLYENGEVSDTDSWTA